MIASANDRKTYQFDLAGAEKVTLNVNVTGSDGVTSGFALLKPNVLRKSERVVIPMNYLLEEAAARRATIIKRMSEGMFKQKVPKNVDFITEYDGSQHRRNKHAAQRNNYYYKLANSRQINQARAFRSKQLIY